MPVYRQNIPKQTSQARYKRPVRAGARRFKAGQKVDVGTLQRTANRLEATGKIRGVDLSDGITGREAQKVRRVRRRQKESRPRKLI
jgi:hypothetical protein